MKANFSYYSKKRMTTAIIFVAVAFACLLTHYRAASESLIPETRIVNGNPVEKVIPFMAYINFGTKYCGGSLIGKKFVLTAAHCCKYYNEQTGGEVILNSNTWKKATLPKSAVIIKIFTAIPHENYGIKKGFDIGIVILDEKVDLDVVKPVVYATKQNMQLIGHINQLKLKLLGWGRTSLTNVNSKSPDLLSALLTSLDMNTCYKVIENEGFTTEEKDMLIGNGNIMCLKETTQECNQEAFGLKGDSGGPLLYEFPKKQHGHDEVPQPSYLLVGVYGGGFQDVIGYGTRVAPFAEWITKFMKDRPW